MELLPTGTRPTDARATFRNSSFGAFLAVVIAGAIPAVAVVFGGPRIADAGLFAWIVTGPFVLIGGLLWLLIFPTLVGTFFATFRAGNWVLAVSKDSAWLNLRSFCNQHFGGDDPTVVRLPFTDIASVRLVREVRDVQGQDGPHRTGRSFLELTLTDTPTEAVHEAVRIERLREAPERTFLGIRSRTRHRHVPVCAPRAGVLWVEWHRGMLKPFDGRVRALPTGRIDGTDATRTLEERLTTLLERDHKLEAIQLVRQELGMTLIDAKRHVEELGRGGSAQASKRSA